MGVDDDVDAGFYVYLHKDRASGVPFYVGKGKGRRAYSKERNTDWRSKVEALKDGYEVEIVQDSLTEDEAYALERELVAKYGQGISGTGPLVNLQPGGDPGDAVAVSFNLPSLAEEYDNTVYHEMAADQEGYFTADLIGSMRDFASRYENCSERRHSDLEDTIDATLSGVTETANDRAKRKTRYKDFCWAIDGYIEDLEFDLEDVEPNAEAAELVVFAKHLLAYLQEI